MRDYPGTTKSKEGRMLDKTSISLRDRYVGTLLGLACGDGLGGPVEFLNRDEIAARFPTGVTEFIGGGWLKLAPGEVTDDTEQALILAESLTDKGLDLDRLATGLIAWYRSNPKDISNTTRIALEALAAGTAPLKAGAVSLAARGSRHAASVPRRPMAPLCAVPRSLCVFAGIPIASFAPRWIARG
jgi:ADP-ribosyl-[dinitrogen reductase] hydrolase